MSAFFIAINRDRQPFDKAVGQAMMSQIDRFGHDARNLVVHDYYALGYQSSWLVPEEEGEQQPLQFSDDSCANENDRHWFMFYGRLDNREFLLDALGHPKSSNISDAVLTQNYTKKFGLDRLTDLIGPFVFLSFDPKLGKLTLARDGMGARNLVYRITKEHLFAASNEMALVAHPAVDYRLNDEAVARHLVGNMPQNPVCIIDDLDVLYPGHVLSVTGPKVEQRRFYTPDPERRVLFSHDDDYAAEFKRLLTQAVERRMRSIGRVGSQLSGGLDSVPVTLIAADNASMNGQQLSAYSWVFEQYPDADERQYSTPLCHKYDIEQVLVNCDTRWLNYENDALLDPLGPVYSPFMVYNHELFKQAESRSIKVMLNGIHGDILYGYRHGILYELIKAGEFKLAMFEARTLMRSSGSLAFFIKQYLLKPTSIVNRFLHSRAKRKKYRDGVLQPEIVKRLKRADTQPAYLAQESRRALRPMQWQVVLGDFAGSDAATGRFLESQYAIERRYPFRDRDLCEFMLSIPTRLLEFNGVKRPIVKRAFAADFPANMVDRNAKANFSEVVLNGFRNDTQNTEWANSNPKGWSYFVKECYFEGKVIRNKQFEVVKWRCGYYDYWKSVCYHTVDDKLGLSHDASKK